MIKVQSISQSKQQFEAIASCFCSDSGKVAFIAAHKITNFAHN